MRSSTCLIPSRVNVNRADLPPRHSTAFSLEFPGQIQSLLPAPALDCAWRTKNELAHSSDQAAGTRPTSIRSELHQRREGTPRPRPDRYIAPVALARRHKTESTRDTLSSTAVPAEAPY